MTIDYSGNIHSFVDSQGELDNQLPYDEFPICRGSIVIFALRGHCLPTSNNKHARDGSIACEELVDAVEYWFAYSSDQILWIHPGMTYL